jgi:hypothetical protein
MGPFIARFLLWLIWAWVTYETMGEFNRLFSLSLNPYLGTAPVAFMCVFHEYTLRKRMMKKQSVPAINAIEPESHKMASVMSVSFMICLLICLLLSIAVVWLGVIYKQIVEGGRVSDPFKLFYLSLL